jgi:hypothetical protein
MSDLTTLAAVKLWLGLKNDTDDALLTSMITEYSGYVQAWLNRQILTQSYTERRSGQGYFGCMVGAYPIKAVSSVTINGQAIPPSLDGIQPGFYFDDTTVWLSGYRFERGRANVQLSYTAGFDAVPPELERAVIELIALRFKERDRIGHQSKSLAGETVTFIVKDFPPSVQTILNNYRKVVPA